MDLAARYGVRLIDLTGRPLEEIVARVRGGTAVMVWIGLSDGPYGRWTSPSGRPVEVNFGEHTLVLADNPPHHPDGDFALEDGVCRLEGANKLTYTGVGVYRPQSFSHIVPGSKAALGPLLKQWIAAGKVRGEHHRGRWVDVGTPQRLAALDLALTKCSKRVCLDEG